MLHLGGLGGFDGRTAEPYNYGTNGAFGYLVTTSPNPELTWEFTRTTNFGLDFGFFKNRFGGSLELYQQETSDILQFVSLPPTSGVSGVTKNIGESTNKGIELSLSTVQSSIIRIRPDLYGQPILTSFSTEVK